MSNLLEAIDKTDWQTFRFDEIAHNISKRVEPGATDLTVYVGLEHLDSGSLHIKRTGSPADVDGTKLLVYAGDVIFGRRRAYQRKAAIATFDGICSAHALVLRANPDVIEPRLFPFFLHSDAFMHRAVDISVGGLSPTINWGNLKVEEFKLPPRDKQSRLAELLWAADKVEVGYQVMPPIASTIEQLLVEQFAEAVVENEPLKDLSIKPIVYGIVQPGAEVEDGVPFIQSNNLNDEVLQIAQLSKTSHAIAYQYRRSEVEPGNLLFSLRGNLGYVRQVPSNLIGANLARGVARIVPDESKVSPQYLMLILGSAYVKGQINRVQQGSTFKEISIGALRQLQVPVLKREVQEEFVKEYQKVKVARKEIEQNLSSIGQVKQQLINQIFSK
jgi:restriction endonuclease S subunit